MRFRSSHAPVVAAALLSAAGRALAGDPPALFQWAALSGDWFDQTNWSPLGVPGAPPFTDADALVAIDRDNMVAITAANAVALRDFTTDAQADLTFAQTLTISRNLTMRMGEGPSSVLRANQGLGVGGTMRIEHGNRVIAPSITVTGAGDSLENLGEIETLSLNAEGVVNTGRLVLGLNGTAETRTIHNAGDIEVIGETGETLSVIRATEGIVNEGRMLFNRARTQIYGDIVHRGELGRLNSGALIELFGSQYFEQGAVIRPETPIRFRNTSGGVQTIVDSVGALSAIGIQDGAWRFEDLSLQGNFSTAFNTTDLTFEGDFSAEFVNILAENVVFNGDFTSMNMQVAARDEIVFHGAINATRIAIAAPDVRFTQRLDAAVPVVLGEGRIHFTDGYSFASDLRLSNARVEFSEGLAVGRDLGVLGVNTLTVTGGPIQVGRDLNWQTPTRNLTHAVIAQGHADIFAISILEPVTASTITLLGVTNLYADLTATSDAVEVVRSSLAVAGNLSIDEITINGDLEILYEPTSALRFNVTPNADARGLRSDLLAVSGTAALEGVLAVTVIGDPDGFSEGQEFVLMTASAFSGEFRSFALPDLAGSLRFEYFRTDSALGVRVVPSPAAALLLGPAIAAPALRRRRRG